MFDATTTRLITDPAVFDEEWVPSDFQYRRGELEAMTAALRPLLDTNRSSDLFVWGPSGAGKTSTTRYLLADLRAARDAVRTVSISCWTSRTRHGVLYSVLAELGATDSLHPTASSSTALLDRLDSRLTAPTVLVLDEVDQLADLEVLYDLYERDEVTLVLLSNVDDEFFVQMDERLRSRLQHAGRVEFDRYTTDELVGILSQRVRAGMRESALTDAHLRAIADAAVGNARDAIKILESAARLAERRGRETLSDAIIAEAAPEARKDLREQTLDRLDAHQLAVYEVIKAAGEIEPGPVYERYTAAVAEPRSKRAVRNYVRKLAHYDLIEVVGENRGRRYRHLGPDDRPTPGRTESQ